MFWVILSLVEHPPYQINFCRITKAQKEGKSESELDEMWWKQAGELVAGYYKQREEVEKDVEGVEQNSFTGETFWGMFEENQRAMEGICRIVSDCLCNPQPDSWCHLLKWIKLK